MAEIIDINTPWEGLSGNQVESIVKQTLNERIGAEYFDPTTNTKFNFKDADTLAEWLTTGDDSLIQSRLPYNFTGTQYQVKVESAMPSKNLYFTTQAEKAEITVSFASQKKGITDVSWQDIVEDYNVSVYVDKGSTGSFTPLIVDQFVMSGKTFTFDVKKVLATGVNRVRVVAVGTESADKAQGSEMFIVNLTSMYLSPSNFTWYKPFIEGETYSLGGMNIGGNLNKTLKVKMTKEGYEKLYEVAIGSDIYTTTAYVFKGLEFPEGGTGVYNVDIWLDANGLESEHLSYNIICVSQADKFTAQLVAIGDPAKTVYNFSDNKLFEYCVYNGGTATATPHIKIAYVVNTNPTTIIDEDLVDVATAAPLTYTASLEIEMEDESAALQLETLMTYGNEQVIVFPVDNSKSYPATTGAVFYLNPSARNNAQSNREKVINSITGAELDATFTRMAWTDGADGWTTDENGRKCLKLPAGCPMELAYQPMASVSQKTIELVYKVKNAADYDEPIFSICSDVNDPNFRGIVIRPKNILIHSRDLNVNDSLQDYNTTDEETLHVLITIIPNYKTNYGNLAQIYVNGDKVRSFSFETADRWDVAANMKFGSETADTYWYKARVYDRGFESYDALKNYINSLPSTKAKEDAKAKIEAPLDDSYKLSYDECVKNGLNTMVVEILDQDQTIPSIATPSAKQCNLWVKINNPIEGEMDADFARLFSGEIIEDQTIEGQGTTAMTYARWNFRWKLGSAYNKRRITAKKNFASSMHSHKMGATRLFNDLNRAIVGPNDADSRVAVYQYPVYGFQKIRIEGTEDYMYEPIGLYTIGPDKGDKKTFGFDGEYESTLIHLEGTDHTPKGVGFDYPYEELGYSGSAEALGAVNATGAVVAAWECGAAGEYDPKDEPTETKAMLDAEFKPAYDVAEKNTTYILGVTETLAKMNANISAWQAKKDAEGRSYADLQFFTDGVYDLYFYNTRTQQYAPRGINMLTDLGVSVDGLSLDEKTELFKAKRRERFMANWETYWHKNDAIFHYAFVLVFGATDNFKKNTYPYKYKAIAEGGVYRWRQDDLDTLFDINNQGLAAKIYSILVGDKTDTGSGSIYRGDTSAFWTLIKECFPTEIKAMVHAIFDKMVELSPYGNNTLEKLVGCVRYYFWDKAQAYFPASAYSKDAEWTYEDTWAAGLYKEVNPLQQSLGGHKEAEIDWVTMRMLFCAMYFNYGPFGAVNDSFSDTSTGQIAYGGAGAKTYVITMACDGNPTILRGQSELVTYGGRVKAGETIELTVPDSSGADTRIYIQGVDWAEDIGDLSDLQVSADNPQLSVASKRLQRLKVGDEDASKVTTNVQALNFGECPSMIIVDARNAKSLTGTIDLSKMPRLMEAYFGGTGVKAVNVPNGSKITVLELGEETTQISLMNLKFMDKFASSHAYEAKVDLDSIPETSCSLGKDYWFHSSGAGFHKAIPISDGAKKIVVTGNVSAVSTVYVAFVTDSYTQPSNNQKIPFAGNATERTVLDAGKEYEFDIPSNAAYFIITTMDGGRNNVAWEVSEYIKSSSFPKLEFLRIENCSQLNPFTMLKEIYNTDGNVIRDIRIIGFDVDGDASDVTMIANLANDVDKDGNPHIYNGIDAEGKPMDNSHPIIEGRLRINGNIYEDDYAALKAVFSNLAMEFLGFYVAIKDPKVLEILLANITTDDGVGLTTEDIEGVTTISTWFKGNTEIETFDEFQRFINVASMYDYTFQNCYSLKSISLPPNLKILSIGAFDNNAELLKIDGLEQIEEIRNFALRNCKKLNIELLSERLTTIGYGGLANTKLKTINAPNLNYIADEGSNSTNGVFANCLELTSAVLNKLENVGGYAFFNCSSLRYVELGAVKGIGRCAFKNCTELKMSLDFPNVIGTIPLGAFSNSGIVEINLPKVEETFNEGSNYNNAAFSTCLNLKMVALNSIKKLGGYTFYGCTALEECVMGSSLISIGNNAFYGCTALAFEELNLPNLTSLGQNAFYGVKIKKLNLGKLTSTLNVNPNIHTYGDQNVLEEVVLGEGLTNIGAYNFYAYKVLTKCIIPTSVTSIGNQVFLDCSALEDVGSLENVTSIGDQAFNRCPALAQDFLLPNLTTINRLAFGASGVLSVTMPNVTTIGQDCFINCKSMTKLDIGDKVTSISSSLCANCSELTSLVCRATTPPSIGNNIILNAPKAYIFVPDASVDAYKAATNWSTYADRIYPLSVYEAGGLENVVQFADPAVEAICLANYDTDGNGVIMKDEAEAVTMTQIGEKFRGNTEITSFDEFELFTGVTGMLGMYSFNDCTALTSIKLPDGITTISGNSTLAKGAFYQCTSLNSIKLPSSLVTIGANAFHKCPLTELTELPSNVETIEFFAFGYAQFTSIKINEGCTKIGKAAFQHCDKLTFIDLPSTIKSIGDTSFIYTSLTTVICRATTPPSLVKNAFGAGLGTVAQAPIAQGAGAIYVPDDAVEVYKAETNWSAYANVIKPLSEYNG